MIEERGMGRGGGSYVWGTVVKGLVIKYGEEEDALLKGWGGGGETTQVLPLQKDSWGGKCFSHAEGAEKRFEVVLKHISLRGVQKVSTSLKGGKVS